MDCFCLRKKTSYDFSSPYTMSSSGTYRTSVIEESAPSKNGHVQTVDKAERDENHHDSIISEEKHVTQDVSMNDLEKVKNDLHNDSNADKDSLNDAAVDKDLHDVNRNHESLQTPKIVIDEVTEVNQVNVTLNADDHEGHNRVSQTSVSSEHEEMSNGVTIDVSDDERHSISEDAIDQDEGHVVKVQGHDSDDLENSLNEGHVSYEEEQNVRNSSYSEEQSEGIKVDLDNIKQQDHTPSYDITAPTEDVPKDVVHMY